VHDRQSGQTGRVSVDSAGNQADSESWHPSISGGGRYVAFNSEASNLVPGDSNGESDIFVYDREPPPPTPSPTRTPTPTATPTKPPGVGGTVKLPPAAVAAESGAPSEGSGWSAATFVVLASGIAGAAVAVAAAGWYARRRRYR
jgi:hypothetical protein